MLFARDANYSQIVEIGSMILRWDEWFPFKILQYNHLKSTG